MPNAWQVFQKDMGGKGLSSKDMGEMWKSAGVKEWFKSLVGAEQGTTAEIASRLRERDPFLHIPPSSSVPQPATTPQRPPVTPDRKVDTPDDIEGWKAVLRGLGDKPGLETLRNAAANTGVALALKAIYDGGDASAGLTQMMKFVTSAEATELSIAAAEMFTFPALVLAATELQGNSVAAAQQGGLLGSGSISGVAGFVRDQMQAGIDERANATVDSTAPSFDVYRTTLLPR
jgi:hypothetical protein